MKPMKNNIKNPLSDECYTPSGQVQFILPYIPKEVKIIWCPCDTEYSYIVKDLLKAGYEVVSSHIKDGFDFFNYEPLMYDCILTNPPFSIKTKFLKRCYALGKPFFLLLPLTTLEGFRGEMFENYGINLAVLRKRVDFYSPIQKRKGKSSCWFNTSWFFGNVSQKNQLYFIDNTNEENEEQLCFQI